MLGKAEMRGRAANVSGERHAEAADGLISACEGDLTSAREHFGPLPGRPYPTTWGCHSCSLYGLLNQHRHAFPCHARLVGGAHA